MDNETPHTMPVNRTAIVSVIAALLTLLSFCTAVAPIPLTGYVCYPAAAILGLIALISGLTAHAEIRRSNENGHSYALIGIWVGAIAVVASLCAATLGILLFPKALAFLHQYVR